MPPARQISEGRAQIQTYAGLRRRDLLAQASLGRRGEEIECGKRVHACHRRQLVDQKVPVAAAHVVRRRTVDHCRTPGRTVKPRVRCPDPHIDRGRRTQYFRGHSPAELDDFLARIV